MRSERRAICVEQELPEIIHGELKQILCIECWAAISGTIYSFSGCFACERCIREYYRNARPQIIELELRERATDAQRIIKSRRDLFGRKRDHGMVQINP